MEEFVEIQAIDYSALQHHDLYSFDREVIEAPTKPLFHQAARFLFILNGEGTIRVQNKDYPLAKGALLAIMPWEHTVVTQVSETLQYYILKYDFTIIQSILSSFYNPVQEDLKLSDWLYRQPLIQCQPDQEKLFLNIFLALRDELGEYSLGKKPSEKCFSVAFTTSKVLELLILVRRVQVEYLTQTNSQKDIVFEQEADNLYIFKYIYSHLDQELTIASVAKLFFISESTLNRYVKKKVGLSFNTLVNEMRIGKTLDMLLHTDLTIEDIAALVGYANQAHLSKLFSARLGTNPNRYRQLYRRVENICLVQDTGLFYKIMTYLSHHYAEALSISKVAEEFDISHAKLNQLLVYHSGKNFITMLNFIRVNQACKKLATTTLSVTDIAYDVGYSHLKTFTRNFVRFQKMQPSKFRKKMTLQAYDL